MRPILVSSAVSGLGGTGGDLQFNITIPSVGNDGLLVVFAGGFEEGSEENPEEINTIYLVGNPGGSIIQNANHSRLGSSMFIMRGASIPPAGTYTIDVNFKDSPKQAERKRGVCAVFRNVRDQAHEALSVSADNNNPRSVNITPVSINSLVIAGFAWETGLYAPWSWGTEIATSRADNKLGVSLAYAVINTPALQTPYANGNLGNNGMVAASFAPARDKGGGFLANFM